MKLSPQAVIFLQAALYILLAPAVVGLLRLIKARLQGRRGADLWQPYRDLLKLLLKRTNNVPEPTTWVFFATPATIFACYLLLGIFLPSFFVNLPADRPASWLALGTDFIFMVYLLGLAKFVTGLAAFDAVSPFGNMSVSRQFLIHIMAEPVLFVSIYALVLIGHTTNIDGLINYNRSQIPTQVLTNPAMALILLSLSSIFLAKSGHLPFDNPTTHLELTMIEQGSYLQFSGRRLALIEWANAMKLTFFLSLLGNLAFPWTITTDPSIFALSLSLVLYLIKLGFLILFLAWWELARPKLRLQAVFGPLGTALVLALLAVIYAVAVNYLL